LNPQWGAANVSAGSKGDLAPLIGPRPFSTRQRTLKLVCREFSGARLWFMLEQTSVALSQKENARGERAFSVV
jgi:hypothetical protein